MKRRRARSNPPTTEQWFLIAGGAVGLGVLGWLIFRKPASSPTQSLIAAQTGQTTTSGPTPQHLSADTGITNQQLIDQGATGGTSDAPLSAVDQAAANIAAGLNADGSKPFSFGIDPKTTYNPNGANLGDPNDVNSAAFACIFSHNHDHATDPQTVAAVNAQDRKCAAAGGVSFSPTWP